NVECIVKLGLLSLVASIVTADTIDSHAVSNCIKPRFQRAGVLQLSDATHHPKPDILKDVERSILVPSEAHCVIKQRPLHDRNQVCESIRIACLTAKRKPLKLDSIPTFIGHLSNMSN